MRISDWSSDVCSSDLSIFPDAASELVELERREQFREEGVHFESRYYLTLLWMPPAEDAARAENWLYEGRSRSEEHTSELQSLMRISYAVFCLKKKNTHIKHYKHIIVCKIRNSKE